MKRGERVAGMSGCQFFGINAAISCVGLVRLPLGARVEICWLDSML